MNFGYYVRKALDVVKLDTSAMKSLAKDQKAFGIGTGILALAGVAAGIGSLNPFAVILAPIAIIIMSLIGIGVVHLIALLFGGKGTYTELYNVVSHSAILNWTMIIPIIGVFLGFLANLWRLVVLVFALQSVHHLSQGKAIVVVLIPVLIGFLLMFVLFSIAAAMFGGFLGGAFIGSMMNQMMS